MHESTLITHHDAILEIAVHSLMSRREAKMFSNFTWLYNIVSRYGKEKKNQYMLLS